MKANSIFVFLLISSFAWADGGTDNGSKCYVHDLEPSYNLFYSSVDGFLTVYNRKGKPEEYDITSNISIYDINTGKITYLFSDTLKERIEEFYFESYFDSSAKEMRFNLDADRYDEMNNSVGNSNLKGRAPSDRMFIVTASPFTHKRSLWMAHKNGTELTRVYEYSDDSSFYIDVKNKVIRFVKQVDQKIEVKDIKY
jgi:hypothetical protein